MKFRKIIPDRELEFRIYNFLDKCFHAFSIGDGEEGYPQGLAGGNSHPQQYIGIKDNSGNKIFEGDIIEIIAPGGHKVSGEVSFNLGAFFIGPVNINTWLTLVEEYTINILGNKFQKHLEK